MTLEEARNRRSEEFSKRLMEALIPAGGVEEMSGSAYMIFSLKVENFCAAQNIDVEDLTLGQVSALLAVARKRYEELCRGIQR